MGTSALLCRAAAGVLCTAARNPGCTLLIHDYGLLWIGRPRNLEGLTENPDPPTNNKTVETLRARLRLRPLEAIPEECPPALPVGARRIGPPDHSAYGE